MAVIGNLKQVNPGLKDVLDAHKKDIMLSMNAHAIATIQSFDPVKQTVSATIAYKKTFYVPDGVGTYMETYKDYPILLDVPIIVLSGGKANLTMPITVGDDCLILFNDRSIDQWFQSGQVVAPTSMRTHSISDGIALIGLNHQGDSIAAYDPARAVLRNDKAMVGVGVSLIKISNDQTTLKTLLQELINAVKGILIDVNSVSPGGGVVSAASQVQLTTVLTHIAGLLE